MRKVELSEVDCTLHDAHTLVLAKSKTRARQMVHVVTSNSQFGDEVHSGDTIMLTQGDAEALNISLSDVDENTSLARATLAEASDGPTLRCAFAICRHVCGGGSAGSTLTFGDTVTISAHPALTATADAPLVALPSTMLRSVAASHLTGTSARGGLQRVGFAASHDCLSALWRLGHPSNDELATNGEPVRYGYGVCLVHVMTGTALASCDKRDARLTNFDRERDVVAATRRSAARTSMQHDGELSAQPALPANVWAIIGGHCRRDHTVDDAPPALAFRALTARDVGNAVRARTVATRGAVHGLRCLRVALHAVDVMGTGIVPKFSALRVILDAVGDGGQLSRSQGALDVLLDAAAVVDARPRNRVHCSTREVSHVSIDKLMALLLGETATELLSGIRHDRVVAAYNCVIAATTDGNPKLQTLIDAYDGTWKPRVREHRALSLASASAASMRAAVVSPADSLAEFALQWPRHNSAPLMTPVTVEQWIEYHVDVAAAMDEAARATAAHAASAASVLAPGVTALPHTQAIDTFAEWIANSWHLPSFGQ